jgi:hypothetical protein
MTDISTVRLLPADMRDEVMKACVEMMARGVGYIRLAYDPQTLEVSFKAITREELREQA